MRRMESSDLRPEFRTEEVRRLMSAYQELMSLQYRFALAFRDMGLSRARMLDTVICLSVFTHYPRGTRPQSIIEMIGAPRQSVRDSLKALESAGFVCRNGKGPYYATEKCAEIANINLDALIGAIERLCIAHDANSKTYKVNGRGSAVKRLRSVKL